MTNTTGTREPVLSVDSPLISCNEITFFWHCFVWSLLPSVICFFPPSQLKKIRSLLVAGAPTYDCFYQHLRLLDGAFKLSAKDLRSQVVREACITVAWVLITNTADTGEYICINKIHKKQKKLHFVVLSHTCFRSCWICCKTWHLDFELLIKSGEPSQFKVHVNRQ